LHAKIDSIGKEFIFTDLQSKNGSFVNGEMVATHKLQHGDLITIGKHMLEFKYKEGEEQPSKADEDLYQTMVMDTNQHREMMKKAMPSEAMKKAAPVQAPAQTVKKAAPAQAVKKAAPAQAVKKAAPAQAVNKAKPRPPIPTPIRQAALSLVAGDQGEVVINKKLFKVGKGIQNDYHVEGLLVGQTSFTLSQRPDAYYLSYVEGIAKPKVNGEPVKTTVRLKEFDIIELGRVKMQLVFKTPKVK
jgi:pSer/pThr/pTyr-binding forkhead associated (FHA) protein